MFIDFLSWFSHGLQGDKESLNQIISCVFYCTCFCSYKCYSLIFYLSLCYRLLPYLSCQYTWFKIPNQCLHPPHPPYSWHHPTILGHDQQGDEQFNLNLCVNISQLRHREIRRNHHCWILLVFIPPITRHCSKSVNLMWLSD